jgi:hypothetical protein
MTDRGSPTRAPLPPPFPVGTRLGCVEGHDAYAPCVDRPRDITSNPEDWVRISGRGIEVEIDRVELGHRGTGRRLRDEDGPMYHDDGEPMVDETHEQIPASLPRRSSSASLPGNSNSRSSKRSGPPDPGTGSGSTARDVQSSVLTLG